VFIPFFISIKGRLQVRKFEFAKLSWSRISDKFAINRQIFSQIRLKLDSNLKLKFGFRIWPLI